MLKAPPATELILPLIFDTGALGCIVKYPYIFAYSKTLIYRTIIERKPRFSVATTDHSSPFDNPDYRGFRFSAGFPLPKYRGKSRFYCIIPLNVYELRNSVENSSGDLKKEAFCGDLSPLVFFQGPFKN